MVSAESFISLAELASALPGSRLVGARGGELVRDIVMDHHDISPGALFVALRGSHFDGNTFASDAVRQGAVAMMTSEEHPEATIVQLVVPEAELRRAMALVASMVWSWPSREVSLVGITGTNGKTTIVHLVAEVLRLLGRSCGTIGTLWGRLTTPEATDLQRELRSLVTQGVDAVAMEVSSIALVRHRVDYARFRAAAFTNLSQDHLDFHETMESYYSAKASLFDASFSEVAIVNVDDPYGRRLANSLEIPVREVSLGEVEILEQGAQCLSFRTDSVIFRSKLFGIHNLYNLLVAIALLEELGISKAKIASVLVEVDPPRGRLQEIEKGQDFFVVVDYAHTPAALSETLKTLRKRVGEQGRVLVVFGCGGDRDKAKRPLMGQVAARLADVVIVTNDNPRTEDPSSIAGEVLSGIREEFGALVELDRRKAVRLSISKAQAGDIVLVAGKGHERSQQIGDRAVAFDDVAVCEEEIMAYLEKSR